MTTNIVDRSVQEQQAMDYLSFVKGKPYEVVDQLPPFHNYWLIRPSVGGLGFSHHNGGPVIATCQLRHVDGIVSFLYLAVEPQHRKRGLGHLLAATVTMFTLINPLDGSLRFGLASMPDGEPKFIRDLLILLGCKEMSGINTDGLPMLYYKHPGFQGDDSFVNRNYQEESPGEDQSVRLRAVGLPSQKAASSDQDLARVFHLPIVQKLLAWAMGSTRF